MSRKYTSAASRTTSTPSSAIPSSAKPSTELPDEFCPVCRRMRYLNADMEFLINPECYHPMCSNCVTNIFGKGPAQCPYASCTKTLRQRGFRSAFFRNLTVEREVDVRRRVQAVFNMVQDDFETLRDYNDYLQQVEDLTFDLVQGGDIERRAAEEKLLAYEQKHKEDIEKNKKRGREAESLRKQRDAADAEAARQRRLEEQREEERARAEEATINAEVMEALARGEPGTAADIQERIIAQKRARVAEIAGSRFPSLLPSTTATATNKPSNLLSIRGLRDKSQRDEDADYYLRPYDPFAGLDLLPTRYTLRGEGDGYANPWLEEAKTRDDHRVPGYSTREYAARAMFEAFAGLGVVIGEEKESEKKAVGTAGAVDVAGIGAGVGAGVKMEVDDVFS
ncbi:CDK-activating kinase assembly factor [Hypoxylon trugodes]|uniref:CDK-activating kinase assembly factor n=1 Tax=Hypoxylon trugodes TaxID=326681 RepID=UPI00219EC8F9|nr:CDK-activating kinase assembly factor [Hypoxylon trugodes]KAI1384207.1 CDK-activating kinase assembly factor [Hypoxylon trugodes]